MDGVALCARFSIATNRLAYCGPADAEPALYDAIVTGTGSPRAREALTRFEALMPYLEALGEANGRDPFDPEVVEAYWLGNELLEAVDRPRFLRLLEALRGRGLPSSIARRLAEHLPDRPLAHHVFHVAYVGVGAVTGHVPTTVPNIEACRPALARVNEVREETLVVEGPTVRAFDGRLVLAGRPRRTVPFDRRVLPEVDADSHVAVHWSWPALELDRRRSLALGHWTAIALERAAPALASLGVRFENPPGPAT
jgi:Family of unknown function (DUF6390)